MEHEVALVERQETYVGYQDAIMKYPEASVECQGALRITKKLYRVPRSFTEYQEALLNTQKLYGIPSSFIEHS